MRRTFQFFGLIILLQLFGCDQSKTTHYTYGKANACFEQAQIDKPCRRFKPYDEVTINANATSQQVTILIRAIDLSKENTIFKNLTNCKVVDKENFSCDELTLGEGVVSESTLLDGKVIGQSSILFYGSNMLGQPINKKLISLFDSTVAKVIAWAVIFAFFVGLNS